MSAAQKIIELLRSECLTYEQMQDAMLETLARYIASFTEQHDRHRIPETVKAFATVLEVKINALMDAGEHS